MERQRAIHWGQGKVWRQCDLFWVCFRGCSLGQETVSLRAISSFQMFPVTAVLCCANLPTNDTNVSTSSEISFEELSGRPLQVWILGRTETPGSAEIRTKTETERNLGNLEETWEETRQKSTGKIYWSTSKLLVSRDFLWFLVFACNGPKHLESSTILHEFFNSLAECVKQCEGTWSIYCGCSTAVSSWSSFEVH